MKIAEGAYSQLIHAQETRQEAESSSVNPDLLVTNGFGSRSINNKPRSQSISRKSTSKGSSSFRNSGRNSFPAPLGLPDPMEFSEAPDVEETTDKITTAPPIGRLFCLNKPEAFVLGLGSIISAIHGVIFPVHGILVSTAIKVFYEPPAEQLNDSRFWASMFVVLGLCAFVLVPIEYFLFGLAGGKLVERVRSLTFQSVMRQEINWFDKPKHSRCVFNYSPVIIFQKKCFHVILRKKHSSRLSFSRFYNYEIVVVTLTKSALQKFCEPSS
jgi:ATP-binding cassette subfamily B (MDR/TAP) protein 1